MPEGCLIVLHQARFWHPTRSPVFPSFFRVTFLVEPSGPPSVIST
jgi:hypothetical protein